LWAETSERLSDVVGIGLKYGGGPNELQNRLQLVAETIAALEQGELVDAGGIVAIHDVLNPAWTGPRTELTRLLWRTRTLKDVRFVDSIAYARKVEMNTATDRVANAMAAVSLSA
jgi:hypothetical protein